MGAALAVVVIAVAAWSVLGRGVSTRIPPGALETWFARVVRGLARDELRDVRSPAITADETGAARAHWADHCALCHGNDGRGDTPIGRALYPPSPDMRAAETQHLTDGQLYGIIENGVRLTGMPAW